MTMPAEKKKLVVLTGAGISAESGLQTFRDHDGLWMGHRVEDVATPEAFKRNPELVMEFYNQRRRNVLQASPNHAHQKLVDLEAFLDVHIITQNVDDLHERAGSKNILHLHGEILKKRSTGPAEMVEPIFTDLEVGESAPDGGIWRPHIVWFGEAVPMMEHAADIVEQADALLIIGTSLQVYPAAGLVHARKPGTPVFILDRKIPEVHAVHPLYSLEETAVAGIDAMMDLILELIVSDRI
jgi:NAD-dependent deacetylase